MCMGYSIILGLDGGEPRRVKSCYVRQLHSMASLSVYGYNPEMLIAHGSIACKETTKSQEPVTPQESQTIIKRCLLLELPLEIRVQIYSYMLPSTVITPKGLAWDRAAPIWATNRQIYNECIGTLYGDSTFLLDVGYDYVDFLYQYRLPRSDLVAKRLLRFPERMAARNRVLMRKFEVGIQEVDGYSGMVKYNYSNPEVLARGVREQVRRLCGVLQGLPEIRELRVVYNGNDSLKDPVEKLVMLILGPFWELEHVRDFVVEMPGFRNEKIRESVQGRVRACLERRADNIDGPS